MASSMKRLTRPALSVGLSTVRRRGPSVIWGADPMNGDNFLDLRLTTWARTQLRATDSCWSRMIRTGARRTWDS